MDTTKTADAGPEPTTPAGTEEAAAVAAAKPANLTKTTEPAEAAEVDSVDEDEFDDEDLAEIAPVTRSTGVGSAAAAVISVALALVALGGTWFGRVLGERQTLVGQISSSNAPGAAEKIQAIYVDAWHVQALANGCVSAVALLVGLFVLLAPAFGAPDREHPTWVKALGWAGLALGLFGVLMFGLMYLDVLAATPKAV
ncbi:hypothetical protein ACN20G_05770 [Streptomyces sp. BI20]|uniref:hypothetical protein n=1 Tax=Streptomyces sp. BI20 TaxID=3403460 RepID=UPI003C72737E